MTETSQTPAHLRLRPAVDTETGAPVCLLSWAEKIGQLTPEEVKQIARHWLDVAEAAVTEAAVRRTCDRLELPDGSAEAFTADIAATRREIAEGATA
ncbi:hypothetical protein [Streptomyces sp. TR02-1]|uniref:hypothetical protein n=1 Tax=Streptomyces sp. TR02-1 TaxID=3385977 RepID=UPI0039A34B24